MQYYSPTLNFSNAPTFSLFIYKRICLVCRGNAFDEILYFFGLWNRIFRDRGCENVLRKAIDLYKPHRTFSEPALPDQIINTSSFSILYFSRKPFHAILHIIIFCKILADDYKLSFLATCTLFYIVCSQS